MGTVNISVQLGTETDIATVCMSTRSSPIVADVLGIDRDDTGEPVRIYLRSLIHQPGHGARYRGWQPSGVISTILTRITQ